MRKHGAVLLSHFSGSVTTRLVRVFVVLLISTMLALLAYGCMANKTYAPTYVPAVAMPLTTPSSATKLSASAGALPTVQTTSLPLSTRPGCTGVSYNDPSPLDPATLPTGLTRVVDAPSHYTVSGSSLDDIRSAIANCPLRKNIGKYHAITTYTLTWGYYKMSDMGLCRTSNVRVGVHVNQYLPALHPEAGSEVVASHWHTYADGLATHEDGHTTIDIEYAHKLLLSLQDATSTCVGFDDHIAAIADTYVTMLNTANELYDARTNHGATQGAVL